MTPLIQRKPSGKSRLDAFETPEGRAIYPFGAWGAGYLVDEATEARLRAYLGKMVWVVMGFLTLQSLARLVVRIPELVALAVAYAAFLVFHYAVIKAILHGTARASFRPSSEELLRMRLARDGRTASAAAIWCGLVTCGAAALVVAIVAEGPLRWVIEAGCALVLTRLVVALRRVQRFSD